MFVGLEVDHCQFILIPLVKWLVFFWGGDFSSGVIKKESGMAGLEIFIDFCLQDFGLVSDFWVS